jgi:hypothetical protein
MMSASDPAAELEEKQEGRSLLPHIEPLRRRFPDTPFMAVATGMFVFGVMLIVLYAASASGFSPRCISIGLFAACTAFVFGVVARLVLNVPQALSPNIYSAKVGRWGHGCCWARDS